MRIYLAPSPSPSPPPSPRIESVSSKRQSDHFHPQGNPDTSDDDQTRKTAFIARANRNSLRVSREAQHGDSSSVLHAPDSVKSISSRISRHDQENNWETEEFYAAVKLRQRRDPVDEYEERGRKHAYQTAQDCASRAWKPVAQLLAPPPSSPTQHKEGRLREAQAKSIEEVRTILSQLELNRLRNKNQHSALESRQHQDLWGGIEKTINDEEEGIRQECARREQEAARMRAADEERRRRESAEAEALARAKAVEQQRRAQAQADAIKRAKDEAEAKERDVTQRQEQEERQAKEKADFDRTKTIAPRDAVREWMAHREILKKLKTEIMPRVRGNKDDESLLNKDYRKTWNIVRRQFTPKIGQVTNSQSEIRRIAQTIHELLTPNPPHPEDLYLALLSSLSKVLLLQAETEVTAKHSTAYPLARIVMQLVAIGHVRLPTIFLARLVGRTGGWAIGCAVPRLEGQSDAEYRKSLGYQPEASGENLNQFIDRIVGMITLYAAILQTASIHGDPTSVPYPFQLPRLWTWIARLMNDSRLLRDKTTPQVLFAIFQTAGDRLIDAYGRQIVKLRRVLGSRCLVDGENADSIGGPKDGKASRMRLGLMLEKWEKDGKIEPAGRDVGP